MRFKRMPYHLSQTDEQIDLLRRIKKNARAQNRRCPLADSSQIGVDLVVTIIDRELKALVKHRKEQMRENAERFARSVRTDL